MHDFHYNSITNKYRDKTKILLTNTDSPMCKIEDENVYEDSIYRIIYVSFMYQEPY